jgi:N-acetylmuramoyl-L-alanine amidase
LEQTRRPLSKLIALVLPVCALLTLSAVSLHARSLLEKKKFARTQFETAQRMREALRGRPEEQRSSDDYEKVLDAYRKVYHTAPTSVKADAAVVAVAELLAESARILEEDKRFQSAIGQYEFLRREYPGSKYRFDALFTIGEIYRADLHDNEKARQNFEEFLNRYPNHRLAEDARKEMRDIDKETKPLETKSPFIPRRVPKDTRASRAKPKESKPAAQTESTADSPAATVADKPAANDGNPGKPQPVALRSGRLPLVTSIRHWSTPDYTRIAIDVNEEIKYEAGRVPSPDRIFFDLHDTKLASELMGKTFDVEDGFLRRIRVAQFNQSMTRVVLEVDDVAEYSAFLLPNPYRLIIDIHGKKQAVPQTLMAQAESRNSATSEGASDSSKADVQAKARRKDEKSPAKEPEHKIDRAAKSSAQRSETEPNIQFANSAPAAESKTAKSKDSTPAKVVVDAEDDNALTSAEIASLSQTPADQKATRKPTSAPIVQNVAPREKPVENADRIASGKTSPKLITEPGVKKPLGKRSVAAALAREAQPTASGDRSLIRALGLKIGKIVVDAGHGGHDTGTIGPNGLQEKDLVLDVALRLGKLLENKLGAEVIYTRDDDTFIPLETRTAVANQNQADLFISIHANSSPDAGARGVETYYLNFTSSPEALEVAARENAVSEKSIHELQDLVKKIALKEKIEESREFATDVEKSLHTGLVARNPGLKNRGVKKAPFIVLIGANMPSILAEVSFVSNPSDERRLKTPDYRQRIAESLYRGVARYVSGLSGVKVASARTSTAGP